MQFLQPRYFYLFVPLLVLLLLWLHRLSQTRALRDRLTRGSPLKKLSSPSSPFGDVAICALANLALAALIVALAHPQWIRRVVVPQPKKMDVVFIIDTSLSMRAQDIRPSRLDRALDVIAQFCDQKPPQDRIGLVAFTSGSVVLSYLTEDPANVRYYIDYLRQDRVPRLGTNIGHALNNGMTVLTKEYEVNRAAINHKRVFILISDGEDHGKELDGAVRNVKKLGAKVHTIAIGSTQGAPIPIEAEKGRPQYVLDAKGNRVISHLDERTLRWVAQQTGGGAYRALTGEELSGMLAQIIEQEREIQGFRREVQYRDVHQLFLFAAFGLLLSTTLIRGARV